MIEFTRPIPMKKTCTMHPENKAVRSVSFTDDNDHTTTITLCMTCLGELEFKAADALIEMLETLEGTEVYTALYLERDY